MIDHVIFAAPDLNDGVAEIEQRFGVLAEGGGQHVGQGTHNKLAALGPSTYLEIIAPDPSQPEPSGPRPYGVYGVTRSGLVGWAIACDDIEQAVQRARAAGFEPGDVIEGQRRTGDGVILRWRCTGNARTGGLIPFLISWGDTPNPATTAPTGLQLTSVRIEHPDPRPIGHVLEALGAEVEVVRADRAALVAAIVGPTGSGVLRSPDPRPTR